MNARLICPLLAAVMLLQVPALANTAEKSFAEGKALVAKGDLSGALAAYASAAQADHKNQSYLQQYMLVRQIIRVKQQIDREKDAARWEYLARALHSFYVNQGVYSQALSVSQKMHAKLKTADSALALAETALAMKKDAEAAEALAALDSGKATASTQALLGVALARLGKADQARQIATTVKLPDTADPRTLYSLARLYAMTGDVAGATDTLTRCFKTVSPSLLPTYKTHAQTCPDFAELVSNKKFSKALETESEVAESQCSAGSSCSGCPMRGSCPSGKGP